MCVVGCGRHFPTILHGFPSQTVLSQESGSLSLSARSRRSQRRGWFRQNHRPTRLVEISVSLPTGWFQGGRGHSCQTGQALERKSDPASQGLGSGVSGGSGGGNFWFVDSFFPAGIVSSSEQGRREKIEGGWDFPRRARWQSLLHVHRSSPSAAIRTACTR